eukprot:9939109-Karenia_brevis.AAC.1
MVIISIIIVITKSPRYFNKRGREEYNATHRAMTAVLHVVTDGVESATLWVGGQNAANDAQYLLSNDVGDRLC